MGKTVRNSKEEPNKKRSNKIINKKETSKLNKRLDDNDSNFLDFKFKFDY